jgi:hypothetical protein
MKGLSKIQYIIRHANSDSCRCRKKDHCSGYKNVYQDQFKLTQTCNEGSQASIHPHPKNYCHIQKIKFREATFGCCLKLPDKSRIIPLCIFENENISLHKQMITFTSQLTLEYSQPNPSRHFTVHHGSVVVLYSSSLVYVVVPITFHYTSTSTSIRIQCRREATKTAII